MNDRSFFVIAYDISNDRRRYKTARLLESLGARTQGSVFEAYLNAEELKKLQQKVKKHIHEKEDRLRIYPLCQACHAKIISLGNENTAAAPQLVVV